MAKWLNSLISVKGSSIEYTIGERNFRFYPISVKNAFKLKSVAKELLQTIQTFYISDNKFQARTHTEFGASDEIGSQTVIDPASKDGIEFLANLRNKRIEAFIEALTDEDTKTILGTVILDSLRDDVERDFSKENASEFINNLDIELLIQYIIGVCKANAQLFRPLIAWGRQNIEKLVEAMPENLKEPAKQAIGTLGKT